MARTTAVLAILFALPLAAQTTRPSTGESVGAVDKLKGHVYWRAKPGAPEKPLTDGHKTLHLGEVFRCGPDGSVILRLIAGDESLNPKDEYTITWTPNSSQKEVMAKAGSAFKAYGRAGAGERGDDFVLAPATGTAVVPSRFTIRWQPVNEAVALKLRAGGRTLWHETVADGATGVLESAAARQALAGAASPLTLNISSASANGETTFSVLTSAQQSALEAELNSWDKQDSSFMRRIGRAAVYDQHAMFAEAAEEYEAALAETPDSTDLRTSAIRAEERAGNLTRARELTK